MSFSVTDKTAILHFKEHRRILEELLESRGDSLGVFDLMPLGVCVFLDRTIEYCNWAGLGILRPGRDDIRGSSIFDFVPPDQVRPTTERIKKTLDLGLPIPPFDLPICRSDGSPALIEVHGFPVAVRGRRAVMMVFSDVTEERRRRAILQETEGRFRDISFSIGDVIWEANADWTYSHAAGKVETLLEFGCDELVGMSFFDVMPPEERERVRALCHGAAVRAVPLVDVERLMLTRRGRKIYVLTNAVPVLDENGSPVGYRGIDRDITDRRLARDVIRESGEKYRAVLEAISDPLYISSPGYRITYLNPAMIARAGGNAVGRVCHEVIHGLPERCPWCVDGADLSRACLRLEIVSPLDNRIFVVSHSPIRHVDGTFSIIHILADITERRLFGSGQGDAVAD